MTQELKTGTQIRTDAHRSAIHNRRQVETPQMSINGQMNIQNVVYTQWTVIQPETDTTS